MKLHIKTCYLLAGIATQSALSAQSLSVFIPKKILSGYAHTCLISTDGQVKCWGENKFGQLGLGSTTSVGNATGTMGSNLPIVNLGNDVVVREMCLGFNFSCALTTTGQVKCWGANNLGQLGQEITTENIGIAPDQMGDNLPWTNLGTDFATTDLQCGDTSVCAMNNKGQVKCWGDNEHGQLGRKFSNRINIGTKAGDMGDQLPYLSLPQVKSVSLGAFHGCAATSDAVHCWGDNYYGQAGLEVMDVLIELPKNVQYIRKVLLEDKNISTSVHSVKSGRDYICAEYTTQMQDRKKIKCWGYNQDGQLGIGSARRILGSDQGTMGSKLVELQLDSSNFIQRETYGEFSCGLNRNGTVQCWGRNTSGQLGLGDTINRGKKLVELGSNLKPLNLSLPVLALSHGSGAESVCALFINHEIKCWGSGKTGQLGYEDDMSRGGNPMDMGENLPFVSYR